MDNKADIQNIKEKILNKSLFAFAFLSIPTMGTSLFRMYTSGWTPLFLFHIAFVLFLWTLYLLRRKISLGTKVFSLSIIGLVSGLLGAYTWGLVGGWLVLLTVPPIIFSLFYGKRFGLAFVSLAGVILMLIAFLDIDRNILLQFSNINEHATFFWINTIITYLFLTSPLVILVGETSNFLESYIKMLKDKSEELERSKEYLASTIDFLPVAIGIASLDGKIIKLNRRFFDMFGYDADTVSTIEEWHNKAFPDDTTKHEALEQWQNCTNLAMQHHIEVPPRIFVVTTANLDILQVEVSFKMIKKQLVFALKDLTARLEYEDSLKQKEKELKVQNRDYQKLNKELEESNEKMLEINIHLKKAKRKAEESDRFKTYFLKNISHEIRTPLNGIMGFSEMLLQENLSQKDRVLYTDFIISNGQQFLAVLDSVITLADIEAGDDEALYAKFDLPELINELEQKYRPKAEDKGISLLSHTSSDNISDIFKSDRKKIKMVFSFLIENAIKFTDEGEVSFGYMVENSSDVSFFVKDTGIGISARDQKNIFGRFMQAGPDIMKKYGGTGLGLAITKSVLNLLGTSVKVRSKRREGSTFTFKLPLTVAEESVSSR